MRGRIGGGVFCLLGRRMRCGRYRREPLAWLLWEWGMRRWVGLVFLMYLFEGKGMYAFLLADQSCV
jgi:hypothetical protein